MAKRGIAEGNIVNDPYCHSGRPPAVLVRLVVAGASTSVSTRCDRARWNGTGRAQAPVRVWGVLAALNGNARQIGATSNLALCSAMDRAEPKPYIWTKNADEMLAAYCVSESMT